MQDMAIDRIILKVRMLKKVFRVVIILIRMVKIVSLVSKVIRKVC